MPRRGRGPTPTWSLLHLAGSGFSWQLEADHVQYLGRLGVSGEAAIRAYYRRLNRSWGFTFSLHTILAFSLPPLEIYSSASKGRELLLPGFGSPRVTIGTPFSTAEPFAAVAHHLAEPRHMYVIIVIIDVVTDPTYFSSRRSKASLKGVETEEQLLTP